MRDLARSTIRAARGVRRRVLDCLYLLPTSFYALLLLLLLAYNAASIFSVRVPSDPLQILPPSSSSPSASKISSSNVMYAIREEHPPPVSKTRLALLRKDEILVRPVNGSSVSRPERGRHRPRRGARTLRLGAQSRGFAARVNGFFGTCEVRFFMTWISSLESFGDRELFALESLFNSHPDGCLVIVSSSLDSNEGREILRPFRDKGHRVMAISPNFGYLFKDTPAQLWFKRLKRGNLDPGEVALGQNLSNLLRLVLLYKFGGVYMDTDVVVLKRMSKLRNVIGAQTLDLETGNWSRLNNAVLVFDKSHPLLFKFIEEFALTFDGNKWGHNGPYLVSRVVSRVSGRPGYNFTVQPPSAFYPVDWSRVRSLFRGPRGHLHSKWLRNKLRHILRQSYAVHLWNKQSRKLRVEEGSIVDHMMSDCCIFCNKSKSNL
ncbi:uncharacterized protein LOC115686682 [Syzygium oleosum]|uniref:uncharacterized protein LOC115686682 n=1 Tax=Syzygium oleosum TaxID=219896 RepID=UPI0024BB4A17|nr:uncharacterized protein LOC115686682 [Syzygium oleosum]